jgi:hypothetical protein
MENKEWLEGLIAQKFKNIEPRLDEYERRIWAANEAIVLPYGGLSLVSRATGLAINTIKSGIVEIKEGSLVDMGKTSVRRVGGGRKSLSELDPSLITDLDFLIEPTSRGDPESPLRWTCKSLRNLAAELNKMGHNASHWVVSNLLSEMGYSLKGNHKVLEGSQHPLRNEQFLHINANIKSAIKYKEPVISVDTKKKEILGNFANVGKEWEPKGQPVKVNTYDFPSPELDRANPYGILDIGKDIGFVNIGTDHDTPMFAVASIKAWWFECGKKFYKNASQLLITADGGGSNSYRSRVWKWELQILSERINKPISVCHFPTGTSKWNKVEHMLFSFITRNWRGRPLTDYETIVSLIRATKTGSGFDVKCKLDTNTYNTGEKVKDENFKSINIKRNSFQGDWNYTILPR